MENLYYLDMLLFKVFTGAKGSVPPALIFRVSVCGKRKLIFLSVIHQFKQGVLMNSSGVKLNCKVHNRNTSNTPQLHKDSPK